MDYKEKVLLLEAIMTDLRMDWSNEVRGKLENIIDLSEELGFDEINEQANEMLDNMDKEWFSGKSFRKRYEKGGYEGLSEVHLYEDRTFEDKSDEFKDVVKEVTTANAMFFEDIQYDV